jgi:phosphatidylserine/phosphatidylglycerophosphate/cardiolipin synthase-like enzyme
VTGCRLLWWEVLGLAACLLAVSARPPLAGAETMRDAIVRHIDESKSSIEVAVYEISSSDIVDALIDAYHRGIRVRVVLDAGRSINGTPQDRRLGDEGVPVRRIPSESWRMLHEKFILFDGKSAFTPSYNYSKQVSQSNAETHEDLITDRSQLKQFQATFETLWQSAPRNDAGENP